MESSLDGKSYLKMDSSHGGHIGLDKTHCITELFFILTDIKSLDN